MKKIINYENEINFKNKIASINSISIEDNYKIENNKLFINFILSGDYKMNELSVNNESFKYDLPLEYELDDNMDKSTISCEIENFEYNTDEEVLSVVVDYKLNYEEKKEDQIIIPSEEEINDIVRDSYEEELILPKEETSNIYEKTEEQNEIKTEDTEEQNEIKAEDEEVSVLKVHIYKLGETIESISSLYGVNKDLIKEYNDISNLEEKDKIIVPITNE